MKKNKYLAEVLKEISKSRYVPYKSINISASDMEWDMIYKENGSHSSVG